MLDKSKTLQAITEQMAAITVLLNGAAEGSTQHIKRNAQLSALYWLLTLVESEELQYVHKDETKQQQQKEEEEAAAVVMTIVKDIAHQEAKKQAIKDNAELEEEINRLIDAGEDEAALQLMVFGSN